MSLRFSRGLRIRSSLFRFPKHPADPASIEASPTRVLPAVPAYRLSLDSPLNVFVNILSKARARQDRSKNPLLKKQKSKSWELTAGSFLFLGTNDAIDG